MSLRGKANTNKNKNSSMHKWNLKIDTYTTKTKRYKQRKQNAAKGTWKHVPPQVYTTETALYKNNENNVLEHIVKMQHHG